MRWKLSLWQHVPGYSIVQNSRRELDRFGGSESILEEVWEMM